MGRSGPSNAVCSGPGPGCSAPPPEERTRAPFLAEPAHRDLGRDPGTRYQRTLSVTSRMIIYGACSHAGSLCTKGQACAWRTPREMRKVAHSSAEGPQQVDRWAQRAAA